MPPKGIRQPRRMCPWCSAEVAAGYLYLHKKQYCPMRPGRQEEIRAEAIGIPPGQAGLTHSANITPAGVYVTGTSTPNYQPQNIISINLMEEYNKMVKIMQKKKEEEVEIGEEYQCGACNSTWHAKKAPKHCPECGTEFE